MLFYRQLAQVRMLVARSHPYSGRPFNSKPLPAAATAYLDLSNSNSNSSNNNNNRIPKANKVLLEHLETNRRSDRRSQPSLNRVDVSYRYSLLFRHLLTRDSIWPSPDSTACYRPV